MALIILTENSILVYDFASLRSGIPFENNARAHFFNAFASLFAHSGGPFRKDELKTLISMVNTNQSVRQCRIGLESFRNPLSALVFGDYLNINQSIDHKKYQIHRRKYARIVSCQKYN